MRCVIRAVSCGLALTAFPVASADNVVIAEDAENFELGEVVSEENFDVDEVVSDEATAREAWGWGRRRRDRRRRDRRRRTPAPTPAPTPVAAAAATVPHYVDLGEGKCVVEGKDPKYKFYGGKGKVCESMCTASKTCYGYSVSTSNNCLLWSEIGLSGGGNTWGKANCHMKEFVDFGKGKCLVSGKDPKHKYLGGQGKTCAQKCRNSADCYGYSVSSSNNCLHWLENGLVGGGKNWGGASCHAKHIQAATYKNAGKGKCLTRGNKDPKYKYFAGQGKNCETQCTHNIKCFGYSVSSSNNCLLWTENALTGGGKNWGNANCHIKEYVHAGSTK